MAGVPTNQLTDDEKVRTRHHLGFMNVSAVATFVLGVPGAVDAGFIIERAMTLVLPEALPQYRKILGFLDQTEQQKIDDQELLAVDKVGDINIRQKEMEQLSQAYRYWQGRLANMLGVMVNPYSKVAEDSGGGAFTPVIG